MGASSGVLDTKGKQSGSLEIISKTISCYHCYKFTFINPLQYRIMPHHQVLAFAQ